MQMLWEQTCKIAVELGKDLNGSIAYDPEVYSFVFAHVLKHRNFHPLIINELFDVKKHGDQGLHSLESLVANTDEANAFGTQIMKAYPDSKAIDALTKNWYNT